MTIQRAKYKAVYDDNKMIRLAVGASLNTNKNDSKD